MDVGKEQAVASSEWIGLAAQTEGRREIAGLQVPKKGNLTDAADTGLQFCYRPVLFLWVRIRSGWRQ